MTLEHFKKQQEDLATWLAEFKRKQYIKMDFIDFHEEFTKEICK